MEEIILGLLASFLMAQTAIYLKYLPEIKNENIKPTKKTTKRNNRTDSSNNGPFSIRPISPSE